MKGSGGAFADYMSVISRVGWVEQIRGWGLRQLNWRVRRPHWPPFHGELADLEAGRSFSLIWWLPQQVDPSLQSCKKPTTRNRHMWAVRWCGLESLSIGPSQTDHERAEYGAQMQFVPILRTNILHEARVTEYQRKWRPRLSSHTLGWLSWHPRSTRDPEGIEAWGQPYGVTLRSWEQGRFGAPRPGMLGLEAWPRGRKTWPRPRGL